MASGIIPSNLKKLLEVVNLFERKFLVDEKLNN
jgi:hypothetical protein